jgi:hypothetical protein
VSKQSKPSFRSLLADDVIGAPRKCLKKTDPR